MDLVTDLLDGDQDQGEELSRKMRDLLYWNRMYNNMIQQNQRGGISHEYLCQIYRYLKMQGKEVRETRGTARCW